MDEGDSTQLTLQPDVIIKFITQPYNQMLWTLLTKNSATKATWAVMLEISTTAEWAVVIGIHATAARVVMTVIR